ncbi:Nitroreductase [Anaerosporobacter mobilis DSM 15930]|jgi:nitroreductase|uniref:Nitroreductase n=1 Tax=Anaerosporobacter mobilis DSM 15930 TaxID=1120996 RepID=A0A1M7GLB3_9FIRM|nr:nitroreductase family protein [Anaerosporobacter mobilis]SHM17184.1 Nitroreductase [Anaerosporobacter mobilis DSM 15930]
MNKNTDFLKLVEERYSVRKFTDKAIEQDTIDKILKAGHLAPTACNRQPQRVLVINNEEGIAKLRKCTQCHFNAPSAMLICYDKNECWHREYDGKTSGVVDASIVTTHMMLEAYSLGVGTTWVMHFIPEAIIEEFSIPDNIEPVALLVMGYPDENSKPFPGHFECKPLEDIVSYNMIVK